MWVETLDGDRVNLDHVARIRRDDASSLFVVEGPGGVLMGTLSDLPNISLNHIVPDASGSEAVVFTWMELEGQFEIYHERCPVVAWAISEDGVAPLVAGDASQNGIVLVLHADGYLKGTFDHGLFESVEAVEACIRRKLESHLEVAQ